MSVSKELLQLDMLNCLCGLYMCVCTDTLGKYFVREQLVHFSLHNVQHDKLSTDMNH